MPQEANTFYSKAMANIKPQIKNIVEKNADVLKGRTINTDSLSKALIKKSFHNLFLKKCMMSFLFPKFFRLSDVSII